MTKILIVDDEELIRITVKKILKEEGYNVDTSETGSLAIEKFLKNQYDLVLLDINLPDINGLDVLKELKKINPDVLVIIVTGYASIEDAVQAIKLGAYDYIEKPLKKNTIKLIVKLAIETQSLKKEVKILQQKSLSEFDEINFIGKSPYIIRIKKQIKEIANHDEATVLITGESGTGKELVARAIHYFSPRKDNPFVAINCAALPDNLLESELFGYEKGAFTNAFNRKTGVIESANNGTLFLDEIGDMDISMQSKLLRFLENKTFRRIGGNNEIEVNVRIISATNKNLNQLISEGKFREDLFYRLNVFPIHIPPLRERREDIVPLSYYYLKFFAHKYKKNIEKINNLVIDKFLSYSWRGNVRELKNIMERLVISCAGNEINIDNLPEELNRFDIMNFFDISKFDIPESGISIKDIEAKLNIALIKKALEIADGNISKAAKLLSLPRETLRDRIKKYNIKL